MFRQNALVAIAARVASPLSTMLAACRTGLHSNRSSSDTRFAFNILDVWEREEKFGNVNNWEVSRIWRSRFLNDATFRDSRAKKFGICKLFYSRRYSCLVDLWCETMYYSGWISSAKRLAASFPVRKARDIHFTVNKLIPELIILDEIAQAQSNPLQLSRSSIINFGKWLP